MSEKIAGLILAGGQSQRFGSEKALALFHGRPLIEIATDVFAGCGAIALSAPAHSGAAGFAATRGASLVEDDQAFPRGPLVGICAGLAWAAAGGFELLAVAPCDTPLLPADLHARLRQAMGDAPAAFAATAEGDHPLCALWRVSLLAPLRATLAAGEHPPIKKFLHAHGAARIIFPEAAAFANVNSPEDLSRLARLPG